MHIEHIQNLSYFAIFFLVGLESIGVPLPGETALIAASVYAGTTHQFNIFYVILFAMLGAILGDNIGYLIGQSGGFFLLRKYGHYIKIDENKLKLGQYLFTRYGGRVVFFGRFVSQLRMFAAFLAGANYMSWKKFIVANAAGAFLWSSFYGYIGYTFGKHIHQLDLPFKIASLSVGMLLIIGLTLFITIYAKPLEEEAIKEMPGPIEKYRKK